MLNQTLDVRAEVRKPIKAFLICSGLGHVNRGYESFTQECFAALRDEPLLDLTLFKGGGGGGDREVVLPNLPRDHSRSIRLGSLIGKSGYWIEQTTFVLSLLPYLLIRKPEVIYFSDVGVGQLLWQWRRLSRQRFNLLFSNGAPFWAPFPLWDYVQLLTPPHVAFTLKAGHPTERQRLLPYGFCLEPGIALPSLAEVRALREARGLPTDRPLVLSVGAVSKEFKRMDYVVREVAAIRGTRPFLVMLGQTDRQTEEIHALAEDLLGADGFAVRTVASPEVADYYRCADIFALASLSEGFGRVYVEALSYGLPCLAHDYGVSRFILGDGGRYADLTQPGALADLIFRALEETEEDGMRLRRHQSAFERFSWQNLTAQYVDMLCACASLARR